MSSKPMSVLITGANRGLGLEMVKQMLETQRPLSVLFACCRDPDGPKAEELQALAKMHKNTIKVIRMDTADRSSIKQSAQQVGSVLGEKGLNLLINNAAILIRSGVPDSTPEDMASTFNTNVIGPMSIIQDSKGQWDAFHNYVPYRVSKAALNMLIACAAVELEKEEILFTLLHPGWVRTAMGGANASIDVQESVQGMLQVMNSMTEKHNGALLDYNGQSIPW